jgi:hypothetical protein
MAGLWNKKNSTEFTCSIYLASSLAIYKTNLLPCTRYFATILRSIRILCEDHSRDNGCIKREQMDQQS